MSFSIVGANYIYDVVVHKSKGGYSEVDLVSSRGTIHLGSTMKEAYRGSLSSWTAFGYYPNDIWLEAYLPELDKRFKRPEVAYGFVSRRCAIEHMLRRTGWWPKS